VDPCPLCNFNATTAFLLRGSPSPGRPWGAWSFNATTAFLLPRRFYTIVRSGSSRFNATTAFLLRITTLVEFLFPLLVSMPPRRSCFAAPEGPGLLVKAQVLFQCHHGVPASWLDNYLASRGRESFNATTAFLLRFRHLRELGLELPFQCHHGVPASLRGEDPSPMGQARFNATTAFLLRATPPWIPT
jgi:hypothetical protein